MACRRAIIDKDTNTVTLTDVLEVVAAEAVIPRADFPTGHLVLPIEFEIVSYWVRSDLTKPEKGLGRVLIQPPEGEAQTIGDPFDVDLTQFPKLRTRSHFSGLRVDHPGRYWFIIQKQEPQSTEWVQVARLPVDFDLTFAEPAATS